MNDNILYIQTLVDRFFEGETTLDEEEKLYDYFHRSPSDIPDNLVPLREMFLDLSAAQNVGEKAQPAERHWLRWAAAAVAAVLVIGGAAVLFHRHAQNVSEGDEMVAYVYGKRTTDHSVVLSEMHKTMSVLAATDGADVVEEQLKSMFIN